MRSTPAVAAGISQADAISLLLAGGLCLLPFLLPYHQLPVLSFQAEWLAAALGIAATLAALMGRRVDTLVALPLSARWLSAFALLLAAKALVGNPVYPQLPLLAALYVIYAVLLIWLGAQLAASVGIERAAAVFSSCLLAGALANAVAAAIQFYGHPALLDDIVAELGHNPLHNGAYGNIAQTSLYANYMALGATALLFQWQRGGLRMAYALAAAVLLAWGSALSGSRGVIMYALWFAVLGGLAARLQSGASGQRLRLAAFALAGVMLAAQALIPWFNHALGLGPANQGTFERLVAISSEHTEARWSAWRLALRVFVDTPIAGTGIGEFAGAAFEAGLAPEMAHGEVWTSAHNLVLHLLAETGAPGTALALGGLAIWCFQSGRRYVAMPQPALWWIIAAVGIELIHSMFEFPLWSAHFLGISALLIGLGTTPTVCSRAASRLLQTLATGLCAALALVLAILLKDYLRLDATYITGTSLTLASRADSERDAAVMRSLAHGPLGPIAELWIFFGAPLDRSNLAARTRMSERLARYYPSHAIIVRRAVLLAFDGQTVEARRLLLLALRSFPHRCQWSVFMLEQARAADRAAIAPLLALAQDAAKSNCGAAPTVALSARSSDSVIH